MMKFSVGDVVSMAGDSRKVGVVAENALSINSNGTHSARVMFSNKKSHWVNDDNLRLCESETLIPIHVPDGVFSVVTGKNAPIVYVPTDSKAFLSSQSELEDFAGAVQRMWLSKQAA